MESQGAILCMACCGQLKDVVSKFLALLFDGSSKRKQNNHLPH